MWGDIKLPPLALFGHGAISELSLLSGAKRKLDFKPAMGSFWRQAVGRCLWDTQLLECLARIGSKRPPREEAFPTTD
jgi:hypothetical protein